MKKIIVIFITLFFLAACQSTKDAFTLKKKSSTDEFLVEKKKSFSFAPWLWQNSYASRWSNN